MLNTPSRQDPALLSSMDPAQIARAVQHCPIPLDSALQVGHLHSTFLPLNSRPNTNNLKSINSIYKYLLNTIIPPLRHHISNLFLSLDSIVSR